MDACMLYYEIYLRGIFFCYPPQSCDEYYKGSQKKKKIEIALKHFNLYINLYVDAFDIHAFIKISRRNFKNSRITYFKEFL